HTIFSRDWSSDVCSSDLALQKKLNGRSEGAIEMKHQNISAVMIELGAMPLSGYRGLPNYQDMLVEAVSAQLAKDEILDRAAIERSEERRVGHEWRRGRYR